MPINVIFYILGGYVLSLSLCAERNLKRFTKTNNVKVDERQNIFCAIRCSGDEDCSGYHLHVNGDCVQLIEPYFCDSALQCYMKNMEENGPPTDASTVVYETTKQETSSKAIVDDTTRPTTVADEFTTVEFMTVADDLTTVADEFTTVEFTTVADDLTTVADEFTTVEFTTDADDLTTVAEFTTDEFTTVAYELTTIADELTTLVEDVTTIVQDVTTSQYLTTSEDVTTIGVDLTTIGETTTVGETTSVGETTTVGEDLTTLSEGMTTLADEMTTGGEVLTTIGESGPGNYTALISFGQAPPPFMLTSGNNMGTGYMFNGTEPLFIDGVFTADAMLNKVIKTPDASYKYDVMWPGFVCADDAYLQVAGGADNIYLLNGNQVILFKYRAQGPTIIYELQTGFPMLMTDHYGPEVPTHVDAADLNQSTWELYFIKDRLVYLFLVSGLPPRPNYTFGSTFELVDASSPFPPASLGTLVPGNVRTMVITATGLYVVEGERELWEYVSATGQWINRGELAWLV